MNFRSFQSLDLRITEGVTCIVGENNTGKSNLLYAIRLAIDGSLSGWARQLSEQDIHNSASISTPQQVLISLEISGYKGKTNEVALVGAWEVADDTARITYRFRPTDSVRDEIDAKTREATGLSLEDYRWELTCGGPEDPLKVDWKMTYGSSFRFSDLQAFQVVLLPALRDVEQDLRQSRNSPLTKLISAIGVKDDEKEALVKILRDANDLVAARPVLAGIGKEVHDSFDEAVGEVFPTTVKVGMTEPTWSSLQRSLTLLLTTPALKDFDPSRNGLGLNNVLYMSMLVEYFEKRIAAAKTAGQLLLVEEPEAHLHPQLQRTLYGLLRDKPFQTIITTHSTFVTSAAPLDSLAVLSMSGTAATSSVMAGQAKELDEGEVADLERYLDATRSALLFARKVLLVEGPAELFLIPALAKEVLDIDFDRAGISIIPIYGVHFDVYAKLFGPGRIEKKCAIVGDGDMKPSDAADAELPEDEACDTPDLKALRNKYVEVFQCPTTFERALTIPGLLDMLSAAATDAKTTSVAKALQETVEAIENGKLKDKQLDARLDELRTKVLNAAKRTGKARFAQLAVKHIDQADAVPPYIASAIEWLMKP